MNLKECFDGFANANGYISTGDASAVETLAKYLNMDRATLQKEMSRIDIDCNGYVSFAELALWVDKHTVGIALGLDVPNKLHWQKGMPKYWKTIPLCTTQTFTNASDGQVHDDSDTSQLEEFVQFAKEFDWDRVFAILEQHPGYINMRPELRRFSAIHQAAYAGHGHIVKKMVEEYGANPVLLTADGITPAAVAAGEDNMEIAEYLAGASMKMRGNAPRRRRFEPPPIDQALIDKAHELIEHAKWGRWDDMLAVADERRDCINIRPEARRYAAIHQVAFDGDVEIMRQLVRRKADIHLMTRDRQTALQIARNHSCNDIVDYLLELDPSCSLDQSVVHSIIDAARDAEWDTMFQLLQENPGVVNVRPAPRTYGIIHQVAFHGHMPAIRRLTEEFMADVGLLTKDGETAQQVAQLQSRTEVAAYLEACVESVQLTDDFVTFSPQKLCRETSDVLFVKFQNLLEHTHKRVHNWTRDRMYANGEFDKATKVPTGYELIGIYRNENPALWRVYQVSREVMKMRAQSSPGDSAPGSNHVPLTMSKEEWPEFDLCKEANEWLLFHATSYEALNAIARTGFTMSWVGQGATTGSGSLYGNGTYFGDSITKADEYARRSVAFEGSDGCRCVGLCRVSAGRYFYTDAEVKDEDKPNFHKRVLEGNYNSTVGDRLRLKNTFVEYITYDASATYLEFILFYKRIGA